GRRRPRTRTSDRWPTPCRQPASELWLQQRLKELSSGHSLLFPCRIVGPRHGTGGGPSSVGSGVEGPAIRGQPADFDLLSGLEALLVGCVSGLDDEIVVSSNAQPGAEDVAHVDELQHLRVEDRKSTRLNSSHVKISYAVF